MVIKVIIFLTVIDCISVAKARMSVIINADMPWLELVHHHLLIYDQGSHLTRA